MKSVLICLVVVLAVTSARPQFGSFGRPFAGGSAGASGNSFQNQHGSALNLNANAQTFTSNNNGFTSSNSLGVASGVLFNSPFGNTANLQNTAIHQSQG